MIDTINDNIFSCFPDLRGKRLKLRSYTKHDAPELLMLRSDKHVMEYMDTYPFLTTKDSLERIDDILNAFANKEGINWAITENESDMLIGDVGFWRIDKKNKRAEIGYALLPQFWRKGYMTEAISVAIKFGFEHLNLHSIAADVNPNNTNSIKLLQKLGFEKEAHFKENYYFNGQFLDSAIYSLRKTTFRNQL